MELSSRARFLRWLHRAAAVLAVAGLMGACNYPGFREAGSPEIPIRPELSAPTAGPSENPASGPLPDTASVFGLEVRSLTEAGAFDRVRALGPAWIRRNGVLWSRVEPSEGEHDWGALAELEVELALASEAGQRVILIVRSTPGWAQALPGHACGRIRPDKLGAFAGFMEELVRRYSAAPYHVKYWELWNEPDVDPALVSPNGPFGCWGDPDQPLYGGEYYAEMLKLVYPGVKRADPAAQILIGGLLLDCDPDRPPEEPSGSGQYKDCSSSRFLEGILANGGSEYFDGISFHAYDYYLGEAGQYGNPAWNHASGSGGPAALAKARFIEKVLAEYGASGKFLMNTEQALLCGRSGKEEPCQADEFEQTKAIYLSHAYATALSQGLQANIWFSLTGWRASGLVDEEWQPTLAFEAYRFAAALLDEARFTRELFTDPGRRGYEFQSPQQTIWVIWSAVDPAGSIELLREPDQAYDFIGQPIAPARNVTAGIAPIYLVWER